MLLNGKKVNNLIIDGETFSKHMAIKLTNYCSLSFYQKLNGNVPILFNKNINISKYLNKKVIFFYTFTRVVNGSVIGAVSATDFFRFTGHNTVSSITNDGDILIDYTEGLGLSINCPKQWPITNRENALGLILEVVEN